MNQQQHARSRIGASEFFEAFVQTVTTADGEYRSYDGKDGFTRCVVRPKIRQIIGNFGFAFYAEYYTIDYTAFRMPTNAKKNAEKAEATAHGFRHHRWDLVAAIEHENAADDWHYEVLKLAPVMCGLRVVIGYTHEISRWDHTSLKSDEERLKYVASLLRAMQSVAPTDDEHEFLVILGNDGRGKADYRGYLYRHEKGSFDVLT